MTEYSLKTQLKNLFHVKHFFFSTPPTQHESFSVDALMAVY